MATIEKRYSPQQAAELVGTGAEYIRIHCRKWPADKVNGIRHEKGSGPNGHLKIPESALTEWLDRRADRAAA